MRNIQTAVFPHPLKKDTSSYELIYSEQSIQQPPKIFTIPPESPCIYVCMYVLFIHMCVCMYVLRIHMCVCIYVYVCMYYLYIYLCMYICMYMCVCMYI